MPVGEGHCLSSSSSPARFPRPIFVHCGQRVGIVIVDLLKRIALFHGHRTGQAGQAAILTARMFCQPKIKAVGHLKLTYSLNGAGRAGGETWLIPARVTGRGSHRVLPGRQRQRRQKGRPVGKPQAIGFIDTQAQRRGMMPAGQSTQLL